MRKHKHEAIIKEWLDTGMPPVEWFDHEENSWEPCTAPHGWFESQEYRLVFPPKPKKQIKARCYYDEVTDRLVWSASDHISGNWVRVPDEDKLIEVER